MLLQIGRHFELEISRVGFYLRVRSFERFYNRLGLPSHN